MVLLQNSKNCRDLRNAQKAKDATPDEKDMDVRLRREFNKNATKMIGEVVHQYPDLAQAVQMYFSQVGNLTFLTNLKPEYYFRNIQCVHIVHNYM